MATLAFGKFLTLAYGRFRDYITQGYTVTDEEIRWDKRPYPELRFTVVSQRDSSVRRVVDWKPLRIWETEQDGLFEAHVSDGKGHQCSTIRDRYDDVVIVAAKIMASQVNSEILKMT